ncbi:serine/threonine protein kinase [Heyndrickxia ginsengihumi]|uniref:Protein kinase domain-containing protein n=1 Tax=Heyndrickxia ginsengihumi TaxID=363870 RepID=A0A0A6VC89_9BACI|nr:protein kinase family protein [Heyndrickxia ginsengihumi]KHD85118.1 hypothetical protein NG54_11050 [Heyndrickxia ginsengihumi]
MRFLHKRRWCGKNYGNYKLIEPIGEGRYGVCYLAMTNDGNRVVIKRFKPRMFKKNKGKNAYEAVILSQIRHDAVPELLGIVNDNGLYGYVLELKQGKTVEVMLFKEKHMFTETEIFHIGSQLINVLKYLHGRGIVHRDIRIPNVLIDAGEVSLIDFGLARWADNEQYCFDQDFSYLGDFLLYLHYSSFKKKEGKGKRWYEELNLSETQIDFYKRLLRLKTPYASIEEVEKDFIRAFSDVKNKYI